MSGPATATSYEESVGSCDPPTPPAPPAPSLARGAPVRRQLDFTGGGDLEDDVDNEFLCRVADDIERDYSEAKRQAPAPPCVCGHGLCTMVRDDQSGQLKYICPSRPKCNHVAFCEEVYLNPNSEPTTRSQPKPSNPCAFNNPSNHRADPRTAVNVLPHVTGTATPVSVHLQVAGAKTLFSDSPQVAKLLMPSTPAKFIPQGAVATTPPNKVSPQGAVATTPPNKVSPQGPKSNEEPICQCRAGKCRKSRIGKEDWYVCPIPKGKGACRYKVRVRDFVEDMIPSVPVTPCDKVHPEAPTMLHSPIAAVNTPPKSTMRPCGSPSPISPNSNDICYRCHEKGHWMRDCPKLSPRGGACFKCGMVGHWSRNCPQL